MLRKIFELNSSASCEIFITEKDSYSDVLTYICTPISELRGVFDAHIVLSISNLTFMDFTRFKGFVAVALVVGVYSCSPKSDEPKQGSISAAYAD